MDRLPEKIAAIRARKARDIEVIRNHATRSDEWKQTKLAELYLSMRVEAEAAIDAKVSGMVSRRRALEAELFGVGDLPGDKASLAISSRDARDRVGQLNTPDEAMSLLNRAERSGDEVLARAIAQRACDMDWPSVANAFQERRRHVSDALNELWQMPPAGVSTQEHMEVAMELEAMKPEELRGLDGFRIQQIAEDSDAVATWTV